MTSAHRSGALPRIKDSMTPGAGGTTKQAAGDVNTSMSVSDFDLDEVLWAQALADLARARHPCCWSGRSPRDDGDGPPDITELLALLPGHARLVMGQECDCTCRVLAMVGDAVVKASAAPDRVIVVVAARKPALAHELGEQVLGKVTPPPEEELGDLPVGVWCRGEKGIDVNHVVTSVPRWIDIEENYPNATKANLDRLMRRSNDDQDTGGGRLILFHGPPGTGKTYAIRALMNEWRDWCSSELVVDPEIALHEYGYLHRLLAPNHTRSLHGTKPWRIVIAEDADRFIRADHRSSENGALDKLLNATDGILAQGSRTLFLLTTNIEIATINPALARPGRCLAVIPFEPFGLAEGRRWLGGPNSSLEGPATLAQLYEMKNGKKHPADRPKATYGQYL